MSTITEISSALQGTSATNGWDAVLALNLAQVNTLFFQQYLQEGPANPLPGQQLRVMLNVGEGTTFWILDVLLGPPEWSFQPGSQDATLEMALIKGSLIAFDSTTRTIHNAVRIRPKESKLSGALKLAKVTGEVNKLGAVVADLGASAYNPSIVGVDPKSILNTSIGGAVTAYFQYNETKFHIGSIAPGDVPGLMPVDFHFTTQRKPNSNDACVLLLIRTSGQDGTEDSLVTYPIPDDRSTALLFSERTLFNGVLVERLNKMFAPFGGKFEGRQDGTGAWSTTATGGAVNLGRVGDSNNHNEEAFSDGDVQFSMSGFTISHSQGKHHVEWKSTCNQNWRQSYNECHFDTHGNGSCHWTVLDPTLIPLHAEYVQSGVPTLNPSTNIVSFPSAAAPVMTLTADNPSFFFIQSARIYSGMQDAMRTAIKGAFKDFSIPDVNLFSVTSLLFPSQHAINLADVSLPGGLYLTGSLAQPIALTPTSTTLAPGQTVQFRVAGQPASDFIWEITPRIGSIRAGLYTAPASVRSAEVVVVTAVSILKASAVGRAMVLVHESPSASGVAIAPGSSLVTPGQQFQLSTTDAAGKPVSVDWTLSPDVGRIVAGFVQGQYTYVAPATISGPTEVIATAVNSPHPDLTGKTSIRVVPSTDVGIKPEQFDLKYGGKIELAATVTADDADDLRWVVYPLGVGKIEPNSDDPAKASYTASSASGQGDQVLVVAYLVNDEAAGLGTSVIRMSA